MAGAPLREGGGLGACVSVCILSDAIRQRERERETERETEGERERERVSLLWNKPNSLYKCIKTSYLIILINFSFHPSLSQ